MSKEYTLVEGFRKFPGHVDTYDAVAVDEDFNEHPLYFNDRTGFYWNHLGIVLERPAKKDEWDTSDL